MTNQPTEDEAEEPNRRGRSTLAGRQLFVVFVVGLTLVAGGTALASWTATSGGDVTIEETTIETDSGLELSATVYEPESASADNPAPGAALIHGYTGQQGTMSSFATELADRGYVAVTVDQPGHGGSEPPAFADGFGGPATLEHTRSLEIVDDDRVAMAGHSMGGFAALEAADDQPEGYESIVLIGSTWGEVDLAELPDADQEFPRNMAVVFAPYDEYAPEMWGERVPADVDESEKLASAFASEPPIEHGKIDGTFEDGTARTFTAPPTIHTGMHRSTTTVGDTLEWVELTIGDPDDAASERPESQTWYWASIGHAIALLGGLIVAVGSTGAVWHRLEGRGRLDPTPTGTTAAESVEPDTTTAGSTAPNRATGWPRPTLLVLSILPAVTIYPLYAIGTAAVPVTRLTHQDLTHGYVCWALGTVAIAAGIVGWRHGGLDRASLEALAPSRRDAGRSLAAAVTGVGVLYVVLALVDAVPGGGLNAWVVGLESLSALRWFSAAVYVVPVSLATVGLAAGLERATAGSRSLPRALCRGLVFSCGGLVVFLAVQYGPLFLGYGMPLPEAGPLAITTINATAMLGVATVVTIAVNRSTTSALTGGLVAGLVVTWMLVGTGPIPVAF
ncbi:alpha/beta fold hydrolase [Salinadaptatus halalkaliphilus]|uniref:Alpha/beta fold hydrolase n=1 Tax=Salinadaptatus halalkaliphilus TaxID=2419781 RepID=A0A4S3TVV4_9EURY|nr:alpha/beta fold hydrolase [Salinadaptatus halalkaliphilus]THE66838.1 alpha/beta fold hydrolase [Salinadaptatus halalkaliphilus]